MQKISGGEPIHEDLNPFLPVVLPVKGESVPVLGLIVP
jgi:hypothetical protein